MAIIEIKIDLTGSLSEKLFNEGRFDISKAKSKKEITGIYTKQLMYLIADFKPEELEGYTDFKVTACSCEGTPLTYFAYVSGKKCRKVKKGKNNVL